jgi:putative Mg2+ transporter-C (MgtC) family protein
MLVSFGSALFILANLELPTSDNQSGVSRTIQGIAAGIGFLGGGEIIRSHRQNSEREEVRGLTSAAAIWVSAALGTLAGCGLWQISLIGAVLSYLVLKVVKKLERYL